MDNEKPSAYYNDRVRCINQRLYLSSKWADVYFVFGSNTDQFERIPSHKNILAAGCEAFDIMFSTELREKRYIPIVDVSAAAFKEFLQFFYLTKVELTTENIVQVTKLCKKFGLIEFLGGSDILHQHLTSNNNLCWGYEFYIFLKHDNYIKNCEEKIKENAVGVLKSPCFFGM